MNDLTREQLASMIDHAVLRPDATLSDLRAACELAHRHRVASLCVRPCDVGEAMRQLDGSGVAVSTVISFPHGAVCSETKVVETLRAVNDGADELDMVVNIARLRDGNFEYIRDEIAAVVRQSAWRTVKVILECCYLTREQIALGCRVAKDAAAHFVKTSTGFGKH